jgi:hypothetical protein
MTTPTDRLRAALAEEYDLQSEIGSGGMGTLYLARERRLDRLVVIKTPRLDLLSERLAARFLREARLLARPAAHPNLVQVYHCAEAAGVPYCVMQYLPGQTLDQALARAPLSADQVARLGRDLLTGLGELHRLGVVHRDVKPSNVLLLPDRAVLIDFGLAREFGTDTSLTTQGSLVGTPAYLAPEQRVSADVGPAADLYAAGLVLYEAATGVPWDGRPDPSRGDWTGLRPRVARALQRALAWDPAARWPDAAAFRGALEPAGWRRRVTVLAAVVAGLGGYLLWPGGGPAVPPADLAILPVPGCGPAGDAVQGYLLRYLEWFPEWRVVSGDEAGGPMKSRWRLAAEPTCTPRPSYLFSVRDSHGGLFDRWSITPPDPDPVVLARMAADSTVARLWPQFTASFQELGPERHPRPAILAYFAGEDAFQRDDWIAAEGHYSDALRLDSTFVLAEWRRVLVRMWRRVPFERDLQLLAQTGANRLPELQRRLIEAQLVPDVRGRIARFRVAVERYPRDWIAALLYANEVTTRGPLVGLPLDSGLALMGSAERKTPYASRAPALDHLTIGEIRQGRRGRAWSALKRRLRIPERTAGEEVPVGDLLRLAWAERFTPPLGRLLRWWAFRSTDAAGIDDLAMVHRLAMPFFDQPEAQAGLAQLVVQRSDRPAWRASGFEALGLARMMQGQSGAALAALDSADGLLATTESRFQALEWRVVPNALGVHLVAGPEEKRARDRLGDLLLHDPGNRRAAWVLALAALGEGDTTSAWRFTVLVKDPRGKDRTAARWHTLLRAGQAAARGRPAEALAISDQLLAYDSTGVIGGAFNRGAVHLWRARWWEAGGDLAQADRELLWYENSDLMGWPRGEAQAGEVDAVFGVFARLERSRLALLANDRVAGCRLLDRIRRLWHGADTTLAPLRARADSLAGRCA